VLLGGGGRRGRADGGRTERVHMPYRSETEGSVVLAYMYIVVLVCCPVLVAAVLKTQDTTTEQRVGVAENIGPLALYSENTLKASSSENTPLLTELLPERKCRSRLGEVCAGAQAVARYRAR
jgi:hypothetical protein